MVIFILLQGVIALFAGVVERVDSCASIQGCGTGCGNVKVDGVEYGDVCGTGLKDPLTNETVIYGGTLLNSSPMGIMKMNQHYKTTYYFLGLMFFFATLGIIGCCHSGCYFCDSSHSGDKSVDGYTNSCVDQYTCYYCWYDCPCCWSRNSNLGCCCYRRNYYYRPVIGHHHYNGAGGGNCNCCDGCCNDCNCSGAQCDCKGGGSGSNSDGAAVLAVIALVIFVILVIIGFIYGLILLTLVMTKIVQAHYAVAQRRLVFVLFYLFFPGFCSLCLIFFLLLLGCVGVFQSNDKKLHRP